MQALPVLVGAIAAACASSFVIVKTMSPQDDLGIGAVEASSRDMKAAEMMDRQAELERELARLAQRVEPLETRSERSSAVEVSDEQVRRVVAAMIEDGSVDLAGLLVSEPEGPTVDLGVMFARLTDANLSWEDSEKLWKEVKEAGLLDEMVAKFEELARAQPDVADAQAALGTAYLQKMFTVGDNEKGPLAMRADRAFDEALELDETHWDARFSKAVSLSFWPAFLGRQPDAMKHFGILIEQQEASGASLPEHAQAYVFLGNMHEQRGDQDKAREIWQRGYDLHPSDSQLASKFK